MVIPGNAYLSWIRNDANALFIRTQMLILQMTAQTQFERQNFFLDNRTRFLHFLHSECNRQPGRTDPLLIRSTHTEIAGKLGCSGRTVSRLIRELEEEGLITLEKGKIQISKEQDKRILRMQAW